MELPQSEKQRRVTVSVIVPLYNKSATIVRTLASIEAQTFRDFEVIVVDDGSTDDSASKVSGENIRLIRQANAGPGAARNRGIGEARGEFLAFLDADDAWLPDYLANAMAVFERHGTEIACVTSGYVEWPSQRSTKAKWLRRGLRAGIQELTPDTPAVLAVAMLAYMSPWSTVARAEAVRAMGGFYDGDRCVYAEDAHLWLKMLLKHRVVFDMEPHVDFHTEASGLSGNLTGPRPVEPFLVHPEAIEAACPAALRPLLADILAMRAQKTACVLGYWGRWREARTLLSRFPSPNARRLPHYVPSLVFGTPLGGVLGAIWRAGD